MKRWLQLRLGIALVVGLVAGAIVWSLPPRPVRTVPIPEEAPNPLFGRVRLAGITSDGRFLLLQSARDMNNNGPIYRTQVWDREKSAEGSWSELPEVRRELGAALFSKDESTLTFVSWDAEPGTDQAAVYDLASMELLRSFTPKKEHREINWLDVNGAVGEFVVFREGKNVQIYSWLTGKFVASARLPSDQMYVVFVSQDSKIIIAQGWPQGAVVAGMGLHQAFIDTTTGVVHEEGEHLYGRQLVHSPDGTLQIWFGATDWQVWLKKVWPMKLPEDCVRIRRWSTNDTLATFYHVKDGSFSPQGNLLALLREDDVIDIYQFPFRAPWGLIALAGISAAGSTWSVGWLLARWRCKPQGGAA